MTLRLAHLISLHEIGGISRDYVEFAATSQGLGLTENHTFLTRPGIARSLLIPLKAGSTTTSSIDRLAGFRLPRLLRRRHLHWRLSLVRPDAVLLWSNPSAAALVPSRWTSVYYEHGAAWFGDSIRRARPYFRRLSGVLCNSWAAKRMLELRWGVDGSRIRVCLNGVRPSCRRQSQGARTTVAGQALRLGAAGRLEPIKGFPLAIHTLACLHRKGLAATLAVAGEGPEREELEALAHQLGIAQAVQFLGLVDDMNAFYDSIDLFLCTSLREPFGLVAAEAMAHGVPVVATAVDGLPEVVVHGKTGLCLVPTLTLDAYQALAGATQSLPPLVYDPTTDRLMTPRAIDPDAMAAEILALAHQPERYAAMSALGPKIVAQRFDYDHHVTDVLASIESFRNPPANAETTAENSGDRTR